MIGVGLGFCFLAMSVVFGGLIVLMSVLEIEGEKLRAIEELLEGVEKREGVEILYACESGSRAWGFGSRDSDYDIRFLFRRGMRNELSIWRGGDVIELPIEDDLDPGGWDLRKSLGLLAKSNGALLEWLHSPIVYREVDGFLGEMRALAVEQLQVANLAGHYRGMCRRVWMGLEDGGWTGKGYLYALRALLCAKFVLDNRRPAPVVFEEMLGLLPGGVRSEVDDLLGWKAGARESDSPGRLLGVEGFLESGLEEVSCLLEVEESGEVEREKFDSMMIRWGGWGRVEGEKVWGRDLSLERVRRKDLLLFETVSGSRSFGTDHELSDIDLRGVFVSPVSVLGGLQGVDQVSDEKSDEVYYELGRFVELLAANNPNVVELLFSPEGCVRYRHEAFELIRPEDFLSKLCEKSFGNYAMGQVRKARGLNKKIVNPEPEERKRLRDFCFVLEGQGSVSLDEWLLREGVDERGCGLVSVNHAPGMYGVYVGVEGRGIFSPKDEGAVVCSSVPKGVDPVAWMVCHVDAFKAHCKSHREYWEWVEKRNEERYRTNSSHGRGYDSKNMMHTMRLLDQAIEIAREGRILLPRANAEWLKRVKAGEYEYDDLLKMAEERFEEMVEAFRVSGLPERPCLDRVEEVLLEVREAFVKF